MFLKKRILIIQKVCKCYLITHWYVLERDRAGRERPELQSCLQTTSGRDQRLFPHLSESHFLPVYS